MDFMGNAIEQGYPFMNMSMQDGMTLLKLLSSPAPDAVAFRHHVLSAHSTYRCDAPNFVPTMCTGNPSEYCGSSREQYVDFNPTGINDETCVEGDAYYIKSNGFADFSWLSPHNPVDIETLEYSTVAREELERVADLLNTPLYSSPENCEYIDRINYLCRNTDDDESDTVSWIDNCNEYLTQVVSVPTALSHGPNCPEWECGRKPAALLVFRPGGC